MKNVKVIVYRFSLLDIDDPDLIAAEPMLNWEKSEQGQWVMNNSIEKPTWHRLMDPNIFGFEYLIQATFTPENYTYWKLKYD